MAACVLMNGWGVQAQETPGTFPAAPGKQVVVRVCTGCHDVETMIGSRRTKLGWRQNVDDMISRGAEGSGEDDMDAVVAYLTAYFGKVNVNTATAQDLEKMLELSEREAQEIVLKKVPGVSAERLQSKRGLIAFSL